MILCRAESVPIVMSVPQKSLSMEPTIPTMWRAEYFWMASASIEPERTRKIGLKHCSVLCVFCCISTVIQTGCSHSLLSKYDRMSSNGDCWAQRKKPKQIFTGRNWFTIQTCGESGFWNMWLSLCVQKVLLSKDILTKLRQPRVYSQLFQNRVLRRWYNMVYCLCKNQSKQRGRV